MKDSMLFHHLDSSWRIDPGPVPNTCWLTFHVDFAFSNPLYAHLAELFFSQARAGWLPVLAGCLIISWLHC